MKGYVVACDHEALTLAPFVILPTRNYSPGV
jgi:hypothetical protein